MKGLFNPDSPLMRLLTRVADLMLLNALWILGCLPVFTIGASTAAMYHVTLHMAAGEEEGIFLSFWRAFGSNFKQATAVFLILLLPLVLVIGDVTLMLNGVFGDSLIMDMVCILPAVVFAMVWSYVYPLTAKFENKAGVTIRNAMLLAIGNLPYALITTGLNLVPVIWMILEPVGFARNSVWLLLGGFAWIAFVNGKLFHKLFTQLIAQKAQPEETSQA